MERLLAAILLLVLALLPNESRAGWDGSAHATSASTSITTASAAGVVYISVVENGACVTSIADTAGLTWTSVAYVSTGNSTSCTNAKNGIEVWSAPYAAVLLNDTITVTESTTPGYIEIAAVAINHIPNTASPLDGSAITGVASLSITTGSVNDMLVTFYRGSSTPTVSTNWIPAAQGASFNLAQYLLVGPTGTYPATSTTITGAIGIAVKQTTPPIVKSNIHNAPGWVSGTSYAVPAAGTPPLRVNNGAAWNGATYTPSSRLDDFQLVSAGGGASTTGPTNSNCAVSCTLADGYSWKYVSSVDYITITGWSFDGPTCAALVAASKVFYHDLCTSDSAPLRSYWISDNVTSAGETCSAGPTGTGNGISAGGCTWDYLADITYTSQTGWIPVQRFYGGFDTIATVIQSNSYAAEIYNDTTYIPTVTEKGGPHQTLTVEAHQDTTNDETDSEGSPGCFSLQINIILEAAVGESFLDYPNLPINGPLTAVNQIYGVAISSSSNSGTVEEDAGFLLHDCATTLKRLQIKSVHGQALWGQGDHANVAIVQQNILESDAAANIAVADCDGGCIFSDNLVLGAGLMGIASHYACDCVHNTIINTAGYANSVGYVMTNNGGVPKTSVLAQNAFFGWAHVAAIPASGTSFTSSDRNATDVATPDPNAGSAVTLYGDPLVYATAPGANTLFSLTASSQFVNTASDWRLKSTSALVGAGASIGNLTIQNGTLIYTFNADTPDIVGATRPNGASYDIGAWEFYASAPPTIAGPGRLMLR